MKVKLVKYSPVWKENFEREKIRLKANIKNKKNIIEHIGSTAIGNIVSKPVIDILISVDNLNELDNLIPDLKNSGYEYISKYENIFPERRFFKRKENEFYSYNIHSVTNDSRFKSRHILFRDWMRYEQKDRKNYENLKLKLEEKNWEDINDYAEAKTEFITKIENKALIEFTIIFEKAEIEAKADMFDANNKSEKFKTDVQYVKSDNGAYAFKSKGLPPFFNRIIGAGIKKQITQDYLNNIKKYYKEINKFMLQTAKPLYNKSNKELLLNNHFFLSNNWTRTYKSTNEYIDEGSQFLIKEIDESNIDDFANMVSEIFKMSEETKNLIKPLVKRKNWKNYLVYDGNKPVGTGGLYISDKTGWFGFATTIPEYRGKGIQKELINKRIKTAKENGCLWVIAETEGEKEEKINPSYRNLLNLGFVKLYNRDNWVYENMI